MPKILLAGYSDYWDVTTGVQFAPVLDRRTGCFVAVADVEDDQAEAYASRPSFRVLTDDEFLALSKKLAPAPAPAPSSETGDPLADAAGGKAPPPAPGAPPAPPSTPAADKAAADKAAA